MLPFLGLSKKTTEEAIPYPLKRLDNATELSIIGLRVHITGVFAGKFRSTRRYHLGAKRLLIAQGIIRRVVIPVTSLFVSAASLVLVASIAAS